MGNLKKRTRTYILNQIAAQIKNCRKCPLWKSRQKTVPGDGPANAKIFFIGQAPGREENLTGKPFVGRAGKFLNKLLQMNKISRKKIYITSIVKCFPPKNRAPRKNEYDICIKKYLLRQIKTIKPKTIVIMGAVAKKALQGKLKAKIIYTDHPAAGMRFPKIRKKMISTFSKIKYY